MKYQNIIDQLTLERKCALLSGADVFKTRSFPEAGIPGIWLSDGPHGLRKQAGASDHLGLNPSEPATCFPTAATVACSWNPELGEEIGEALGREAVAQKVNVVLGPGLNIKRNPLCGRNFEYFSEDPYLAGKMAAAYVRGIQKNGVSACPKHFAVNSQETRRMASDSILDERTLREIYLTGFEIAIKEGRPKSIMTSYNLVNGVYANENGHLIGDILKGEWGFEGAIVTDWGGSNDHALGVKTGSALEMPAPGGDSVRELMKAVQNGKIREEDIDRRVDELLELVFSTNEALQKGAAPAEGEAPQKGAALPDDDRHHELARRAALESIVLLKNAEKILPLKEGAKVAVIGDFAENPRYQGAGSSMVNVARLDKLLDCLQASKTLQVAGYARGFERFGKRDEQLKREAVELAKTADTVIMCLGLGEIQESEGLDRPDMKLNGNQVELLQAVRDVNPNIVAVLFAGSAVETPWRDNCKAILYACLGGQAGASAITDVLTGRSNPGGKLAESWPERYEDVPSGRNFAGKTRAVEYREGLYVGYRYFQKKKMPVAFPFGYGMSYTTFVYSDLQAEEDKVSFTLTNAGERDGAEIAQLYVSRPQKAVFGPVRELKGFARIELKAGESRRVEIPLDDKAFRYWNVKTNKWETAEGEYTLSVGSSCEKMELSVSVDRKGSGASNPYQSVSLPHYEKGDVEEVPKEEFEALLGGAVPDAGEKIGRNMTIGEINHGRSPIGWLAWAVLTGLLNRSMKKGNPDLNLLFIYNMPLRGIAKMTNGMVSMGMVDGMVMELKGFWLIGIFRILYEFCRNSLQNKAMEKRLRNPEETHRKPE